MGWLGTVGVAMAAGPWAETFDAERRRILPVEGARSVMAVGDVLPAAAALCRQISEPHAPCTVKALPRQARRDTDAWIVGLAPPGTTYVVRPMARQPRVIVTVFDAERQLMDWYVAHKWMPATPSVESERLRSEVHTLREEVTRLRDAPAPGVEFEEAEARLADAVAAMQQMDPSGAGVHLDWLAANASDTPVGRVAYTLAREVAVVGRAAAPWGVRGWVQGEWAGSGDHLVVFWEPWCRYSKERLPVLEEQATAWADSGVAVVTVAGVSQQGSPEAVKEQIHALGLTLPVALGTRRMAEHYDVDAVPAAVLIRGGSVVWRGHLAHVTPELWSVYDHRFE